MTALLLAAPQAASAKFVVESARVCGAGECQTITSEDPPYLPFEILSPLIEPDRASGNPINAASQSHYLIKLGVMPENTVRVEYLPAAGQIRVLAQPGAALEFRGSDQVTLNRGWIELRSERSELPPVASEADAWTGLVRGISPIPGEQQPEAATDSGRESGFPWGFAIAAAALCAAAILWLLLGRLGGNVAARPPTAR